MMNHFHSYLNLKSLCWAGLFLLTCGFCTQAQTLVNHGAAVVVSGGGGATIHIDGNLLNQNGGVIDNSGQILLSGDWTNDAGNSGLINSSPGEVTLIGGNQNISGTSVTNFYDLNLTGAGVKTLGVDATVEGTLMLNSSELATDVHTVFVENTAVGAVTRSTGFVSSLGNGGLSRDIDGANGVEFMVGSSVGTARYRPVTIMPNSSNLNTFKVRFANVDPTSEGYSVSNKESALCEVNDAWYHRIDRTVGNADADIAIWYDTLADGAFDAVAHWQIVPEWQSVGTVSTNNNPSPMLSRISFPGWNDFSLNPFALATINPLTAAFTCDSSMIPTIAFLDQSTGGVTAWDWEFGDGNTSTQQNPTHTYTSDSLFEVSLIVTGQCGTDTASKFILIKITGMEENPDAHIWVYPNPSTGEFKIDFHDINAPEALIDVFDLSGRRVYSSMTSPLSGMHREAVDLSEVSNGSYLLRITVNGTVVTRKVVKQ